MKEKIEKYCIIKPKTALECEKCESNFNVDSRQALSQRYYNAKCTKCNHSFIFDSALLHPLIKITLMKLP